MKHYHIVTLDTLMRQGWYGQGLFGVSDALKCSAKLKHSPRLVFRLGEKMMIAQTNRTLRRAVLCETIS